MWQILATNWVFPQELLSRFVYRCGWDWKTRFEFPWKGWIVKASAKSDLIELNFGFFKKLEELSTNPFCVWQENAAGTRRKLFSFTQKGKRDLETFGGVRSLSEGFSTCRFYVPCSFPIFVPIDADFSSPVRVLINATERESAMWLENWISSSCAD